MFKILTDDRVQNRVGTDQAPRSVASDGSTLFAQVCVILVGERTGCFAFL